MNECLTTPQHEKQIGYRVYQLNVQMSAIFVNICNLNNGCIVKFRCIVKFKRIYSLYIKVCNNYESKSVNNNKANNRELIQVNNKVQSHADNMDPDQQQGSIPG